MNEQKLITARPDEIAFSLTNPRGKDFTKRPDWPDFVESVRTHGVKNPPLCRPLPKDRKDAPKDALYELVAGERRVTAADLAKLEKIQILLEPMDDATAIELQQIENLQREDLTALEEAQGYADWRDRLLKGGVCKTVDEAVAHICAKVGRKRSAVYGKLALLKICPEARKALQLGKLDASKAGLMAQIPDATSQKTFLKELEGRWHGPLSFRAAQELLARGYRVNLKDASFDLKAAYAEPKNCPISIPHTPDLKIITCGVCPLRSGNMAKDYPEFAKLPNICTNPACFKAKTKAHTDTVLSRAKSEGRRILGAAEYAQKRGSFDRTDERCWEDAKRRTYAQLGKIAGVRPIVTVNNKGAVMEVFSPEDKVKIKEACKIRPRTNSNGEDRTKVRARQQKEKAMDAALKAAIPKILDKLAPKGVVDARLWPLLAQRAYDSLDISRHDFMAKRLGVSQRINDSRGALEKYMKNHATPGDCARQVAELLLLTNANGGGWHEVKWDKTVLTVAKLAGINLEKLTAKHLPQKNAKATKK